MPAMTPLEAIAEMEDFVAVHERRRQESYHAIITNMKRWLAALREPGEPEKELPDGNGPWWVWAAAKWMLVEVHEGRGRYVGGGWTWHALTPGRWVKASPPPSQPPGPSLDVPAEVLAGESNYSGAKADAEMFAKQLGYFEKLHDKGWKPIVAPTTQPAPTVESGEAINITDGIPSEIYVGIGRGHYEDVDEYELARDVARSVRAECAAELATLRASNARLTGDLARAEELEKGGANG